MRTVFDLSRNFFKFTKILRILSYSRSSEEREFKDNGSVFTGNLAKCLCNSIGIETKIVQSKFDFSVKWGESRGCTREEMISFFDSEGNVPLHSAVHGGDIKAVELCLKSGAKISTQQHDLSTPVHLAW